MFDWVGGLEVRERSPRRLVLGLTWLTKLTGWICVGAGALGVFWLFAWSSYLALVPGFAVVVGVILLSLQREIIVDRRTGYVEVRQHVAGIGSRYVVPLLHLRAVVVEARPGRGGPRNSHFVASIERRGGSSIYIDEARRCAGLLSMAEAIAEVAEVHFEYDATRRDL